MKRKMRVVWLSPFPIGLLSVHGIATTRPVNGHPCSWIVNWARALAQRPDIDLHVVTYSSRVRRSQQVVFEGYTVHVIRDAIPFTDRGWAALWDMDAASHFWLRRKKLTNCLQSINPDIVHGHGTENAYGLTAVTSGYPSVVSIQGIISDYLRTNPCRRYRLVAPIEVETIRTGHNFMCRTHYDKGFIGKVNPSARMFHMPEAMNPCFFEVERSPTNNFCVLHVGGYDERKGLEDLLRAVAILKETIPSIVLEVVGSGSEKRRMHLVEVARSLGILDCITFHGFLPAPAIAELHAKASVFAMTSQNENSPNTLAEALCAGTPCVAYDMGGVASMFEDGESGLLVPYGNVEILAEKIKRILDDRNLAIRLGLTAKDRSNDNRPERVAELSVKAYKDILDEG